jgi:hypothetical protein
MNSVRADDARAKSASNSGENPDGTDASVSRDLLLMI